MSSLLSIFVDNLSDRLYNDKCIDYKFYLDYILIEDYQLIFKCFKYKKKKKPEKGFNKDLIKRLQRKLILR